MIRSYLDHFDVFVEATGIAVNSRDLYHNRIFLGFQKRYNTGDNCSEGNLTLQSVMLNKDRKKKKRKKKRLSAIAGRNSVRTTKYTKGKMRNTFSQGFAQQRSMSQNTFYKPKRRPAQTRTRTEHKTPRINSENIMKLYENQLIQLRKTNTIWKKKFQNEKKEIGRLQAWREYNYRKNPNYYKNPFKPLPRKPNKKSILFQKSSTNW